MPSVQVLPDAGLALPSRSLQHIHRGYDPLFSEIMPGYMQVEPALDPQTQLRHPQLVAAKAADTYQISPYRLNCAPSMLWTLSLTKDQSDVSF